MILKDHEDGHPSDPAAKPPFPSKSNGISQSPVPKRHHFRGKSGAELLETAFSAHVEPMAKLSRSLLKIFTLLLWSTLVKTFHKANNRSVLNIDIWGPKDWPFFQIALVILYVEYPSGLWHWRLKLFTSSWNGKWWVSSANPAYETLLNLAIHTQL